MNKNCYRHVFNRARGIILAVSEHARSRSKRSLGQSRANTRGAASAAAAWPLRSVAVLLPLSVAFAPMVAWGTMVADVTAPGNQRPTVLTAPNGVPLVNIQTPSAAGVSRNSYSRFDVGEQGAILNNSRTNVQTQLGGWVQGNPWLSTGSATVILNEVNSVNRSHLQGYLEVAGQRAQVVIANPAGITCSDCGFINANRATITTGAPIISDGRLDRYRVTGGTVTIAGANGLDSATADYTDIIAQSVQINAGLWAQTLKVTAGVNEVNAAHTQTTPLGVADTTPAYAIDVAQLGGMYAGQITLVGTQDGVGVRHGGQLGASAGNVVISAAGHIESRGSMRSDTADVQLTSGGDITHTGTIESAGNTQITAQGTLTHSGSMQSDQAITIGAKGNVHTTGGLKAKDNITVVADGGASQITGSADSVTAAGMQSDGSIAANHGSIRVVATGALSLSGKHLSGSDQTFTADSIALLNAEIGSDQVSLTATGGGIDVSDATIVVDRTLQVSTPQTLTSDRAAVSADELVIQANALANRGGTVKQTGATDLSIDLTGDFTNTAGVFATNSANLTVTAATLTNTGGQISHAGNGQLTLDAATLTGGQGSISTNGDLRIKADQLTLNNATTVSQGRMTLDSVTFDHRQGTLIQMGSGAGIVKAGNRLDNTGGMMASVGDMAYTVGDLINTGGTVQVTGSGSDLTMTAAGKIDNDMMGDIYGANDVTVTAAELNGEQGEISADANLGVTVSGKLDNSNGVLAANKQVSLQAGELVNQGAQIGSVQGDAQIGTVTAELDNGNGGRIEAKGKVTVAAQGLINRGGEIVASSIELDTKTKDLDNSAGKIVATGTQMGAVAEIASGALDNDQGLIQAASALSINTNGQSLTNTGSGERNGIIGQGAVTLDTGGITNQAGYIGSKETLELVGQTINNRSGLIVSEADLVARGSHVENQGGQIQTQQSATITLDTVATDTLDNTGGLLLVGGALTATADTLINDDTVSVDPGRPLGIAAETLAFRLAVLSNDQGRLIQTGATDLSIDLTGNFTNTAGVFAANSANLTVTAATLTNTGGQISHAGNGQLTLDAAALTGGQGSISTNGDLRINADQLTLNNATTVSQGRIKLDGGTVEHRQGTLIQMGSGAGIVKADNRLDNTGGTMASVGDMAYTVGDLINTGGTVQVTGSGSDLTMTAAGKIDNDMMGDIYGANDVTVTAAELNGEQGEISADANLGVTVSGKLDNSNGVLAANKQVSLQAGELVNQGAQIGSVQGDAQIGTVTAELDNGNGGRIEAKGKVTVAAQGLINRGGEIVASSIELDTKTKDLDNSAGKIVATGTQMGAVAEIASGALDNDQGLIQAASALSINTNGQSLTNTGSGERNGIIGQGAVTLDTGNINNQTGYIGSKETLELVGQTVDNTQSGILLSHAQMRLMADALDNRGGQIQSLGALTVELGAGQLDNTASLIRSAADAQIVAGTVLNNDTAGQDKGLEAASLNVAVAQRLDNTAGVIRSDERLVLAVGDSINNTDGVIASKNNTVSLADRDLSNKSLDINNRDGTLIAGTDVEINVAALSGDGTVLSDGDIDIALTDTYTHTGQLYAEGNAKLDTMGDIEHRSVLAANESLELTASTINTRAASELKAGRVTLTATGTNTLNHRGLIDGNSTEINAVTLNNVKTGRIYGDHVSISAATVNNKEKNGKAPIIAARNRLDIAAQTINNIDHALIFSAGDLAIGGMLDAERHAMGQAGKLNNRSATVEALGHVDLSAAVVNNVNDYITTEVVKLVRRNVVRYQLNPKFYHRPGDERAGCMLDPCMSGRHKPILYKPSEVRLVKCRQVTCIKVKATGDKSDTFIKYKFKRKVLKTVVTNSDPARLLAGGGLSITADTVRNNKSQIVSGGDITETVDKLKNIDEFGIKITKDVGVAVSFRRKERKGPDITVTRIRPYQRGPVVKWIPMVPAVYEANTPVDGTGTQVAAYTNDFTVPDIIGASDVTAALRAAQGINNAIGVTANESRQADGVQTITADSTDRGARVITIDPIIGFNPNGSERRDAAATVLAGNLNRQVSVDDLSQQRPDVPNNFLVETTPIFANYRDWLGSEYLREALSVDPATTQQRLGDMLDDQTQEREQVAELTGRRFLEDVSDGERQYRQLMQDGALFTQQYELRPGVDLSREKMAQLTTDVVWLVERNITLAGGEVIPSLVPQLYVQIDEGDLSATGGLIATDNALELDVGSDLNNIGTIARRRVADVTAANIDNLADQQAEPGLTTRRNRVAGLYVSSTAGLLGATAGLDFILEAAGVQGVGAVRRSVVDDGDNAAPNAADDGSDAQSDDAAIGISISDDGLRVFAQADQSGGRVEQPTE